MGGLGGFQGSFWKHFSRIFLRLKQHMKIVKKLQKINGFSLIFQVLGGLWGSKNCKKSIKIGLERFRRAQNDAKTGQERSGQRKMSQHEAPMQSANNPASRASGEG